MADGTYREAGRRGVQLDERRQDSARRRIEAAMRAVKYHEAQARAERAKAEQIARTWDLSIVEVDGHSTAIPAGCVTDRTEESP